MGIEDTYHDDGGCDAKGVWQELAFILIMPRAYIQEGIRMRIRHAGNVIRVIVPLRRTISVTTYSLGVWVADQEPPPATMDADDAQDPLPLLC